MAPRDPQQELKFFQSKPQDCEWLVELLDGRDWLTADQIAREIGAPSTDTVRRKIRSLAEASEGRIAGGQSGYKLVRQMTKAEFDHFEAWMLSQSRLMQRRITLAQKVFYTRSPLPS